MSDLPVGWRLLSLNSLAAGGLMVDGDWIESKDQDPNGDVRLIQLADIGDGVFLNKSSRFLTSDKARALGCTFLEPGDVLIARMPDPLGRACIFPGIDRPAVTVVDVCIWRPGRDLVCAEWLKFFVNTPEVRSQIAQFAGGTTRQRISGGNLKRLEVPAPPFLEQQRIASKLGRLFIQSKSAREELARVPRLIDRYKLSVLAMALRGDATVGWRAAQTSVDLTQLPTEKTSSAIRTRNSGIAGPSWLLGIQLPETWSSVTLESVGEVILGRQRSPENHIGPNMRPYVRAANVTWKGWDLSDVKQMNFDDRDFTKFRLQVGDVLINEGSGSANEVGKPAIWRGEIEDCCFQNTLVAIRPRTVTSEYLYFVLFYAARSGTFVDEIRGVNIHHIGRAGLAQFVIPVPPITEQREIVQRVESALGKIEELFVETSRAIELLDRLDQAALSKAFRGELISHDPNDEPLSSFFERINAPKLTNTNRSKITLTNRKNVMPKLPLDSVKEAIRQMPTNRFTFEDLRKRVPVDYDTLREAIFEMLSEDRPAITQIFDVTSRSICFTRGGA